MNENKLLDRVRKLLTQAEDPGVTPEEAETFNAKAAALIAQYGIDQALLAHSGQVRDEITQVSISIDNPYSGDKARLLNHIADPLRCKTIRYSSGKSVVRVVVVGFKSDIERVELLYTSLLLQAANGVSRVRPDNQNSWDRESTRAYRISWLLGFRTAVYDRLVAAERQATKESHETGSTGTELVLVDRKSRVDTAFAEAFPNSRTVGRKRYTGSGYDHGHSAGQSADLGSKGVGGNRGQLGR